MYKQFGKFRLVIVGAIFLLLIIGLLAAFQSFSHRQPQSGPSTPLELDTVRPSQQPTVSRNTDSEPTPTLSPTTVPIPTQKNLTGITHTFQTFNNCGPASLSMALSHFSIAASQQHLGNQLRPYQNAQGDNDDKSVTLRELAQLVETDYDLIAYHRPSGDIQLLEQFIAADIPVITRTWLSTTEDIGHYRVVRGYDQNQRTLIQDDSLQGQGLSYSYQEFNEIWQAFNFEFLVLVPPAQQAEAERILGPLLDTTDAWELAEQRATAQLTENPEDMYARFNLLVAQYHQQKYQQAVTNYEQIEQQLPSRMLWYQIEPILAYYQLGEYQRVLSLTEQIFAGQNRAFSELQYLRGLIYEQTGENQQAQAAFAAAQNYNQSEYWKINLAGIAL